VALLEPGQLRPQAQRPPQRRSARGRRDAATTARSPPAGRAGAPRRFAVRRWSPSGRPPPACCRPLPCSSRAATTFARRAHAHIHAQEFRGTVPGRPSRGRSPVLVGILVTSDEGDSAGVKKTVCRRDARVGSGSQRGGDARYNLKGNACVPQGTRLPRRRDRRGTDHRP